MTVNNQLEATIFDFARMHAGNCDGIAALAGDASMRRYYRIRSKQGPYIVCFDETLAGAPDGEHQFLVMQALLERNGIPVPGVVAADRARGLLLLEDLGDELLEDRFPGLTNDEAEKLYGEILDILARIQSIAPDSSALPFNRSFDMERLMFEFDFFIEHAVRNYFSCNAREAFLHELRGEFVKIAESLQRPELFVLNHRDFHSRNIMLHGDAPYIIDFQDARMGLPQYDLASLLRDSYVRLDERVFTGILDRYYELARGRGIHSMCREEFDLFFDLSAFQRNVKAIGTFAYQSRVLGRRRYEPNIDATLSYLGGYVSRRTQLARAGELIGECAGVAI